MSELTLFELKMNHPINDKLETIFKAFPEDTDYHNGHFYLQEDIDLISEQINKGIQSAWFTAQVTVRLKGTNIEESEYLGCCSYESFEDFIESNDYFTDMVNTATSDLRESITKLNEALRDYIDN